MTARSRMPSSSQPNREFAELPPGSLFGANPSGRAFGRMGQIHMGRTNPFGALVAGLTADEFLPLREAVNERRYREEVAVGTLAEAAAAYRPDPGCGARGALRVGSHIGMPAPSSSTAASRSPPGSPPSSSCAQRPRRVRGRAVRRHPQDGLRVAAPCARNGFRLPRPDRAARHRLGGRDLHR